MAKIPVFFTILWMLVASQPVMANAASVSEARTLIEQGSEPEAIKMLQKLSSKKPGDYQIWFMLGVAETHQKNFQAAIGHFRKVITLRPALAEPHNNLAVIYNEMGDIRASVKELEASLELNPDYVTAQENIGDMYVKLALEAYQKALVDQDDNQALRLRYERLIHLRDSVDTAKKTSDTSGLSAKPAKPEVLPLLGDELRADVLAAVEQWRKVWSARDMDAYFAVYGRNFVPDARFPTRQSWEKYKRKVTRKKSFIEVKLENIQLSSRLDGLVQVDFLQYFKSDHYQSEDQKRLLMEKQKDGWKIVDEATL